MSQSRPNLHRTASVLSYNVPVQLHLIMDTRFKLQIERLPLQAHWCNKRVLQPLRLSVNSCSNS